MHRPTLLAAAALLFSLAGSAVFSTHASAQSSAWAVPTTAAFDLGDRASSDTGAQATNEHRLGAGLIATGLTLNAGDAVATVFTFFQALAGSDAACSGAGGCHSGPDWAPLFAGSVATAGVGLVMFFVGLGLDIHSHVLRGHAAGAHVALDARGFTLTF